MCVVGVVWLPLVFHFNFQNFCFPFFLLSKFHYEVEINTCPEESGLSDEINRIYLGYLFLTSSLFWRVLFEYPLNEFCAAHGLHF